MKKLVWTALVSAVIVMQLNVPAKAGGIIDENTRDFSKLTCSELIADIADDVKKGHPQDQATMLAVISAVMWADGYISHDTGDTASTQQWLGAVAGKLMSTCSQSGDKTIIEIVKESAK
jgi:hypothetical protein